MAYLGKTPSQAVRSRYYFTASGGETSLSGTDDNSNTLTFTDGNYVDVSLNGVALVAGSDYNTTTANTISGLAALTASDVVEVVVYDTFSVFGGAFTGDISLGDNVKAKFGASDDLQIYHDGSNSYIDDAGTGFLLMRGANQVKLQKYTGEEMLTAVADGAVTLFYNNAGKLATTSSGIDVTGTITFDGGTTSADLNFGDNDKAVFGAGSDLQIYHDGNNSLINDVGTGDLRLRSNGSGVIVEMSNGNDLAQFLNGSGEAKLMHNGSEKLTTTSTGIDVTGAVSATSTVTGSVLRTNNVGTAAAPSILFDQDGGHGATGFIGGSSSEYVAVINNGSETARFTNSGNVGIGTTSPSQPLTISTSGANGLYLLRDGSTAANSARLYLDSSNTPWAIMVEDGELSFRSAPNPGSSSGTERVAITVNGINSSAVASNTTASSANLFISGGNNFQKSTSSRRYKTEITDATHGLVDVLNLRSVTYKGVNDGETLFGGLIAEEVHDAGLTHFVNYEEDDEGNLIPDGLHYGHMVALAFKAIQELKAELDAEKVKTATLETQRADLEARLTALENAE